MMAARYLLLTLLALLSLTVIACEDDPILQPQHDTKKTGGSYSRIIIDTSRTPPTPLNRANPTNGNNPTLF